MANLVRVEPTEFRNLRSETSTLGVRVYDDYDQAYDNTWEKIPEDDLDILRVLRESDDKAIVAMLDHIEEHKTGVEIGGTFYDWDEIKHIFEEESTPKE